MALSIPLDELGCLGLNAVFTFAVGPAELVEMGLEVEDQVTTPSEQVRGVRVLMRHVCAEPAVRQRLTAALDLRYADTLMFVRSLGEPDLPEVARAWLESPRPEALPGLIWALVTDPREQARRVGVGLAREATWISCHALLEGARKLPHG